MNESGQCGPDDEENRVRAALLAVPRDLLLDLEVHCDLNLALLAACRAANPDEPLGMDSYHPSAYGQGCVAAARAEVTEDVARRPP